MPVLAFDVRANHDTGVSRYGLSLLAASAHLFGAADWRVIVIANAAQRERALVAAGQNGAEVICGPAERGFVRRAAWLREMLTAEKANLYFTSHYTVDRRCPVPFAYTVHDLTRLRLPEFSYTDTSFATRFGRAQLRLLGDELAALAQWAPPDRGQEVFTRYFWAINRYLAQRASKVVTVSHSSAHDVSLLLNVEPGRLAVVRGAVDTSVFHPRNSGSVRRIRSRLQLNEPYLMFVGLTHPHKRFTWLLEQLLLVQHRFPASTRLVAVGGHAERDTEAARLLDSYNATDFVVFTGRISDNDLAALYSDAAALVVASLNEGINLPSLEAMACDCPVIATDIPPLHEALGGAGTYYPPLDGEALAHLCGLALTSRLPPRAARFDPYTWETSGKQLFRVLTETV